MNRLCHATQASLAKVIKKCHITYHKYHRISLGSFVLACSSRELTLIENAICESWLGQMQELACLLRLSYLCQHQIQSIDKPNITLPEPFVPKYIVYKDEIQLLLSRSTLFVQRLIPSSDMETTSWFASQVPAINILNRSSSVKIYDRINLRIPNWITIHRQIAVGLIPILKAYTLASLILLDVHVTLPLLVIFSTSAALRPG